MGAIDAVRERFGQLVEPVPELLPAVFRVRHGEAESGEFGQVVVRGRRPFDVPLRAGTVAVPAVRDAAHVVGVEEELVVLGDRKVAFG